ncbi:MAG: phosphatase PAP2 family protein [Candidatus Thiodiazotropha sp. 6PLUC9]
MFQDQPIPLRHLSLWLIPVLLLCSALWLHQTQLNTSLFLWINHQVVPTLSPALWETLTILGDGLVALTLLLPFYKHHPKAVIAAIISGLIAAILIHLLKAGFPIPRPAASLDRDTITIIGPILKQGSFPSGHTATIFALLGSITLWIKIKYLTNLLPILAVVAIFAAFSRIAVGAHWPLDILIGATLGWISAFIGSALTQRISTTPQAVNWLGRFLTLCTLYLLLFHQTGYFNAQPILHGIALLLLGITCLQHLEHPTIKALPATS